jgi:hypothetical protein
VYFKNVHPKFPDGGKMSQHLNSLKLGDTILMKGPKVRLRLHIAQCTLHGAQLTTSLHPQLTLAVPLPCAPPPTTPHRMDPTVTTIITHALIGTATQGHLDYLGRGRFTITKRRDEVATHNMRKIGMVAGGTGITPMLQVRHYSPRPPCHLSLPVGLLSHVPHAHSSPSPLSLASPSPTTSQVIRAILKDPSDRTELWLIFANQSEDDILLRKELEAIRGTWTSETTVRTLCVLHHTA